MKRFITYLIVIAATIYTAVLYGSTSFLMLFYVELALPVFLLLTLIPTVRQMRIYMELPVPVTEQGQKTPVMLHVSTGGFPVGGKVAVLIKGKLPMGQKTEKTWFYTQLAGRRKTAKIKAEYDARCVGNIRMEIGKVWCYDFLGLVALPLPAGCWKALEPETLLVLPRISEVPVLVSRQSRDFAGESEEYSKERGGDDPSEVFQIRNYQPGDKLRSIHWKLSAKTEEMMVREQSLPLGCPVDFYLDLYRVTPHHRKDETRRDSYLQILVSISHSMVVEGCRHYVIWFDSQRNDICRYRIENEDNIFEMLFQLGQLSVYHDPKDLQELYRQKYHETPAITCLELTTELMLKKNGETEARYSGDVSDIERQLGAKELVV